MAHITTTLVRKPGPFGRGRRCSKCPVGNRTILCSYNPSDTCSQHGGWIVKADESAHNPQDRRISGDYLNEILNEG